MTLVVTKRERLNQLLLFFYFGVAALCLATRSPDLKRNLHVDNGTFGVLLSLGTIGSVFALLSGGQMVLRYGVGPVLLVTGTMMYGSVAWMPHIHTPWVYVIANVLFGFGLNGYNIAVHEQALNRQLLTGEKTIPRMHGAWSVGTLFTTVLSIALTSFVSLAWHIDVLMAVLCVGTLFSILWMRPYLIRRSTNYESEERVKTQEIWSMLTTHQYIAIAYVCAVMVEFSTNDWVTLSSHQEIGASTTLSIVPYLIFMVGMIIGRLGIHKLLAKRPETFWIPISARIGGGGFIILLLLAKYFASHNFSIAFSCEVLGFFIGGLGGSFFAGVLTQIASGRSNLPGGVVVAQLGLAVAVLTFVVKIAVSWVAQNASITLGLMIPGTMMILLSFFKKLGPVGTKPSSSNS